MTFDLTAHEETIDKLIADRFSASFMSNSKWEKLFRTLDMEGMILGYILLKRVDREKPYITYMPKSEDLENIWVAEGKNDCNYFYKEIEWLELLDVYKPGNLPVQYVTQTTKLAKEIVSETGQFETEQTELGLRIYGYKI